MDGNSSPNKKCWNLPDLRPMINTNFTKCSGKAGLDFMSRYQLLYDEHQRSLQSDFDEMRIKHACEESGEDVDECCEVVASLPGSPSWQNDVERRMSHNAAARAVQQMHPVWCLDCQENLIAIGCANGRLEFWEASTGTFKVTKHHLLI